jgi:N-methylhydantoinase B
MTKNTDRLEPYLLALLASRMGSISIQMNNIMIRSSRSSVLALARDCSTAICDFSGDVITFPAGFPVHVGGSGLSAKAMLDIHGDDIRPGDAYLLNSPYHGNTHPADHTILVPVFDDDDLMFITLCRGHLGDVGNSIPSTYHITARDVYEEGAIIFPCVKIQEDYRDIKDIINICRMRIRVPEVWYGDYLAMIGASRIAEKELKKLIDKYGRETIKAFMSQWQEYGRQRMIEEIGKLPSGKTTYQTRHDPVPGIIPEGVPVKVGLEVRPEEGRIICDFTDNPDSMPCGLNLSEATLTSAARSGVLNRLPAKDLPKCEGALAQVELRMREGSIVGKSKHPFSSSVATTNVNDRALNAVQCAFNDITDTMGMGECKYDMGAAIAVISGNDSRHGGRPYVSQIINPVSGSAGVKGHDGYLHHALSNGGMFLHAGVERIEKAHPIVYLKQELMSDRLAAGQWDGAPAVETIITTCRDEVTFVYLGDGALNRPKGAGGGEDGWPAQVFKMVRQEGLDYETVEELPSIHQITLAPGEAIQGFYCSSGAYGDPLERNPELVRHRAREGWLSLEKARQTYGVVLDTAPELFAVDMDATKALRAEMRAARGLES